MFDWQTLQFARAWPFGLAMLVFASLFALWRFHNAYPFPDNRMIAESIRMAGLFDRAPIVVGLGLIALLILVLAEPSIVKIETTDQRARDFLILVDTSRSMRHDSEVKRDAFNINFERRAGAFASRVETPRDMPYVARYELARESLLGFLEERRAEDRVGLIYFNDDAHPVSALTPNIAFVVQQLAAMDDYVNWGTNIAAAMDSGLNLLERYPDQNKRTVILLTDAETRFTDELEQQLSRLAGQDLSFYLLWITDDSGQQSDESVSSFLEFARSVGTVFSIETLDAQSLQRTFTDIGRMESYDYQEVRRRTQELAPQLWQLVRILFLIWLTLMTTVYHPILHRHTGEAQA